MDFTKYGESFEKLHHKHQEYLKIADKRVIGVLDKMLKEALLTNDQQLIGYIYHSMAFAEHFIMGRYQRFIKNLELASAYLLRCPDQSELVHVYYLIAIDAMNKGLNDIAVLYFREARSIAEETEQRTAAAILDESIGHILMNIGQYKEARKYLKRSLAGVRKDKIHPHYYSNMASNYINEALSCLELQKHKEAKDAYEKAEGFIENHPNEFRTATHINFELLRFRIALIEEDDKEASDCYKELLSLMHNDSASHMYMDEIRKLFKELMKKKKFDWAEGIIRTIEDNGIAPDAVDALKHFAEIKIDYYSAIGEKGRLIETYMLQDEIQKLEQEKRRSLGKYLEGLIKFTTDLRKEREIIFARQEVLINMTESDSLTKLHNRYGANAKLDEAFEKAYTNESLLGIAYIDVDGLKEINDTKGHLEGDKYLISLAGVLRKQSAKEDYFAARIGGDEFILIFEGRTDEEIEECIDAIREESDVKFSSGTYNDIPHGRQKSWDYLEFADMELYKEKKFKKRSR